VSDVLITVSSDAASDSWGFVGVVQVGRIEAYRTLEAFPTPSRARHAAQEILAGVLGELLAGAEWRRVRESKGSPPTRRDLALGVFDSSAETFDRPGAGPPEHTTT
jgi:hypothetical protein